MTRLGRALRAVNSRLKHTSDMEGRMRIMFEIFDSDGTGGLDRMQLFQLLMVRLSP